MLSLVLPLAGGLVGTINRAGYKEVEDPLLRRRLLRAAALRTFVPSSFAEGTKGDAAFAAYLALPPSLATRCRAAFVADKSRPSKLQRAVVRELAALELQRLEVQKTPW